MMRVCRKSDRVMAEKRFDTSSFLYDKSLFENLIYHENEETYYLLLGIVLCLFFSLCAIW